MHIHGTHLKRENSWKTQIDRVSINATSVSSRRDSQHVRRSSNPTRLASGLGGVWVRSRGGTSMFAKTSWLATLICIAVDRDERVFWRLSRVWSGRCRCRCRCRGFLSTTLRLELMWLTTMTQYPMFGRSALLHCNYCDVADRGI